jgi:hypothetical protein
VDMFGELCFCVVELLLKSWAQDLEQNDKVCVPSKNLGLT